MTTFHANPDAEKMSRVKVMYFKTFGKLLNTSGNKNLSH